MTLVFCLLHSAIAGYTSWSTWRACDQDCGDGIQLRTRNCTDVTGANRGMDCGNNLQEEKACVGLPKCVGEYSDEGLYICIIMIIMYVLCPLGSCSSAFDIKKN